MRRGPLLLLALVTAVAGIVLLHGVGAPPLVTLGYAAVVVVLAAAVLVRRRAR